MPLTDITTLPPAPARTDTPEDFITKADNFIAALGAFVTELNALAGELEVTAALIALGGSAADPGLVAMTGKTPAADRFIYFTSGSASALATLTTAGRALIDDASASDQLTTLGVSAYIKTLLDDADAAAARGTLSLGTMATQAAGAVAITGGTIAGITDLALADGGTGASNASDALTNLGISAFIKTLLDDADAATARTTLGVPASSSSSGTATSGYMDIPTTGLGTIRVNWGRTTVGANSTSSPSLAASYTTALVGGGQAMSTAIADTDSSYCYLSSTTTMTIANGTDGSLTFQWWAIGVA